MTDDEIKAVIRSAIGDEHVEAIHVTGAGATKDAEVQLNDDFEITFDALAMLSDALGTKLIDISVDGARHYDSGCANGDNRIWIRGIRTEGGK